MFKFNTTTIINSNEDFTTGDVLFQTGTDPIDGQDVLQVKRGLTFKKKYVRAIYKRAYNEPELAQVEVDLSAINGTDTAGVYRIAMYIRLQGSENEYYANDYVFKGKPFYIEFVKKTDDETAADLAEKVVKIAKKYMQMVYEYPLIKVEADGSKVIFTATDEYQRFNEVQLQFFDQNKGIPTGCCGVGAGEWDVKEELDVTAETNANDAKITWGEDETDQHLLKGKEGFGTYRNLVKNLRLPTADNLRWGHILQDEAPVPGANYTQYTVWYCRKVGIQGLAHVGDIVQSLTSHIFFVNDCVASAFETALANVGTITEVTDGQITPDVETLWETAQSGSQGGNEGGNAQGGNEGGNSQGGNTTP